MIGLTEEKRPGMEITVDAKTGAIYIDGENVTSDAVQAVFMHMYYAMANSGANELVINNTYSTHELVLRDRTIPRDEEIIMCPSSELTHKADEFEYTYKFNDGKSIFDKIQEMREKRGL